ncbi:Hypothetical predicted protein [Olea europaea subsp. europaea]|uniref:DUF7392 domain-containing protein n=1 Tax=Olea europaea subsp. europaea TaxID=158383 RepID=A0A8S0S9C8_OLEEU|nr:Hypothetical predicted protein [Olea europaea subsp. europaea]
MACFVPFNNRNLHISLLVFRPTVLFVDDLVDALKQFSLCTENLGCIHSSIFRSIHGNMIVWYGAWMKRSTDNKQLLNAALISMLTNVASMAILIDSSFFEAYNGESKDGSPAAKFFNGDVISLSCATILDDNPNEHTLSCACLSLFKDHFIKMEGATAGVCMKSQTLPKLVGLFVWKSLQFCYSDILNSDCRNTILPYFGGIPLDVKYDIFRVVYVS